MQNVYYAITVLTFAAHAMLGCGLHYTCKHGILAIANHAHDRAHDCGIAHQHDCDHSQAPANEHPGPATFCDHADCSFVKADNLQIDGSAGHDAFVLAPTPTQLPHNALSVRAANELLSAANLAPTQLYVWHCALLI